MKKKLWVISLILAISVFALWGCREIDQLKKMCSPTEPPGYEGIGIYQEGKLISFVFNQEEKFVSFGTWIYENGMDERWFVQRGPALGDTEYGYVVGQFAPAGWDATVGLMGFYFLGGQQDITKKEFLEATKPLIPILLKGGIDLIDATKPIAVELELISPPKDDVVVKSRDQTAKKKDPGARRANPEE